MTVKTKLTQGLIAGAVAVAFAGGGLAIAQSNPPTTMGADPATAAGQQSTQATPMGSTGTPTGESSMNAQVPASSDSTTMGTSDTLNSTPVERDAQADRN